MNPVTYASPTISSWLVGMVYGVMLLASSPALAEPVPVRHVEGSIHGFLALRSAEGKLLASGDLMQVVHGDRAVSRLVFRFRDGSIDDETSVFSLRKNFRLISDHHIQKGPVFPKPMDVTITTSTGQVTVRYRDKDQQKVETDHLDLPADLANGIMLDVIKNISPNGSETNLSYLATSPKPRIVKLRITAQGDDGFSVAGVPYKATRFNIKIELGGMAGMIAPLVGKQPTDINVWVDCGEAPAFVKLEGPLYLGGPVWGIEMTNPVWPRSMASSRRRK